MSVNKGVRILNKFKARRIDELRKQGLTWRQIGLIVHADYSGVRKLWLRHMQREVPGKLEMFEGKLCKVVNPSRVGWWRFHEHYDRNGYCDNPARGY